MEPEIIISVCIPTFNRIHYLKRQVNYLLSEKLSEFEVIISDNASTDGTVEYLKSLKETSNITVLINDVNIGTEGNMYRCVDVAKGQYIYFLGDDDYLATGFLEHLLDLINKYHASFYHFNYTVFDDKTLNINLENGIPKELSIHNKLLTNSEISRLVAKYYGALLFISSNVYKRDFIQNQKENCFNWVETLRLSILSMQTGNTYIDDESSILCGVNSSWSDKRGVVWFHSFPQLFDSLRSYGFEDKDIQYMKDNVLSGCIFNYYRSKSYKQSEKNWTKTILGLCNMRILYYLIHLYVIRGFAKFFRIFTRKKLISVIDLKRKHLFRI